MVRDCPPSSPAPKTVNTQSMATTTTTSSSPFLCLFLSLKPSPPKSSLHFVPQFHNSPRPINHAFNSPRCFSSVPKAKRSVSGTTHLCFATRRKPTFSSGEEEQSDDNLKRVVQIALWVAEGVYILWLFLLPYAPVCTLFIFLLF